MNMTQRNLRAFANSRQLVRPTSRLGVGSLGFTAPENFANGLREAANRAGAGYRPVSTTRADRDHFTRVGFDDLRSHDRFYACIVAAMTITEAANARPLDLLLHIPATFCDQIIRIEASLKPGGSRLGNASRIVTIAQREQKQAGCRVGGGVHVGT